MVAPRTGQHPPRLTHAPCVAFVPEHCSTGQLLAVQLLFASHLKLGLEIIRLEANTDQLTAHAVWYAPQLYYYVI